MASSRTATLDQNDPQFWACIGPARFEGRQAVAQWWQSAAAPAAGPLFSADARDFPAFVPKWKNVRASCGVWLEDDQLCDIFREKCMPPVLARRLALSLL